MRYATKGMEPMTLILWVLSYTWMQESGYWARIDALERKVGRLDISDRA